MAVLVSTLVVSLPKGVEVLQALNNFPPACTASPANSLLELHTLNKAIHNFWLPCSNHSKPLLSLAAVADLVPEYQCKAFPVCLQTWPVFKALALRAYLATLKLLDRVA